MIDTPQTCGLPSRTVHPNVTLQQAHRARLEAELAGCEMEELAAELHRKPPVGRWPRLTQACFGPSVAVLSG
jgi:hypothetical protein